jgi:hypothetical protein
LDLGFWLTQGSAVPGSDATSTEHRVTIPAGAQSVTVAVNPPADPMDPASSTVLMTLFGAAGYRIGTPFSSSVTLDDGDMVP